MSTPPVTPAPAAAGGAGEKGWTVLELLRWTTSHFEEKGIETARLDAEILLAHALGLGRMQLYMEFEKLVLAEERVKFRELVRKRSGERIPVSILLGEKEFWSLTFKVTGDVLTPRPDTETLVQEAINRLPDKDAEYTILDIGTGSGAIALALASERPNAHVLATDISEAALKVAASNAEQLHLSERVRFVQGNLFEPVNGAGEGPFDVVVSNPPYIARSEAETLPPELRHEPDGALFGGEDGLEVLRPLVAGATEVLKRGGSLLVEIDPKQAEVVAAMCSEAGLSEIAFLRDLSTAVRAVAARNS